ncbi:hypothetical protein [Demequina sp.]|uniref:hypothetical protein n=1 Tax=Demequina sp. TaxID=2050685 RepID=UPI003A877ACC
MASPKPPESWDGDQADSMVAAEARGDQLALMKALRTRIVARIAEPAIAARDLGTLALRLIDVSAEIAKLESFEPEPEATPVELAPRAFDYSAI